MKNIMKNVLKSLGLIFLFTLASSCATTKTALEPAPGTLTSGWGHHEVTENLSGVEFTANADAWKGIPEIVQEVIPIKVIVRNHHGKPITVQYHSFSLVSNEGRRYAANPPEEIHGTVSLPAETFYTGPSSYYFDDPAMVPYFGYYPGSRTFAQPFYYDPWWYSRYSGGTMPVQLPTKDMVTEALPEMRVPDGGEISGFIYFSQISGEKQVNLNMDVVETDGPRIGTISIPFVVEQKKK